MKYSEETKNNISFTSQYPEMLPTLTHEDEVSNHNTEDSLISSSRNSQETINSRNKDEIQCCHIEKIKHKNGTATLLSGIILLVLGITSLVWTPFYVLMNERLRMMPGFPPYDWWKSPPDEVLLRVYVFNITNSEEFLNGTDSKLNLQEIGPIIFMEKLIHKNVTFNENGTMTYVAKRTAIFLEELNSINLNQTLVLPNLAVLGMASYFWDASFFTKLGFNLLVRNLNSQPIVKSTIYNYLWNFSDPILDVAQNLAPKLVPVKNMGILSRIYDSFEDTVTVYVGTKYGHSKYFLIDVYDHSKYLPGQDPEICSDVIQGSTEGVAYPQFLNKNSTVRYWRKTICKPVDLFYDCDVRKYGVDAYKFYLPANTYDRSEPPENDCFKYNPVLSNGLSDVSKCYFDFPMAASFPHFLYGDDRLKNYVTGLTPNSSIHDSFVVIEPMTGIPLESRARSQSNILIRPLSGFNDKIQTFSDIVLPMFWAEYNQVGLPWYISSLMYFTVEVIPILEKVITALFFAIGSLLLALFIKRRATRKKYLTKNKALHFEEERFLHTIYK